jgi:lysophospholipase L1-like esterase
MKPLRIFIFFLAVALLLFLLALVFPRQGIPLTPGLHLKFATLSEFSARDSAGRNTVVDRLVAASTVTEDPESDFPGPGNHTPGPGNRTAGTGGETEEADAMARIIDPANVDSLKQAIYRIRFPEGGGKVLDPFFAKLDGLLDGSVARTRILHFGDSQIEIDRMTALIRYRLQKQFGGSGTGLVQAVPLYAANMAYEEEVKGEWLRYTFFGNRDSTISHNAYGIMGAFTSIPIPVKGTWPSLEYSFNTQRRTGKVDRVRVFMHSYVPEASMTIMVNDTLTDTIRHIRDGFSVVDYRHPTRIGQLTLSMNMPQGGRIYGISFESYLGLQMDNIAMRGGSGLIFTKMNRDLQMRMLEYLSPGLLILQYGGNVVPYINADFYHHAFRQELELLKDLCPGVPIIVIGPSDMSLKVKGNFETYPGIEPVRNALRDAADESGVAFWDLYEAMGGINSMPSFVHTDPPLAAPDYVHFTALGVNLMAEMFYNALMLEYEQYSSRNP